MSRPKWEAGGLKLAVTSGATLSDCRKYRYRLWREWGAGPALTFVMLNPSTADATLDDPTIRRCMGFARAWGFGRVEVVNLFAWRSPKPYDLLRPNDPVGPLNDAAIEDVTSGSKRIVLAWGSHQEIRKILAPRAEVVFEKLKKLRVPIGNLGTNSDGMPKHPLYLSNETQYQQVS